MDLTLSEKETAFRDELRGWLAENPPPPEPTEGGEDANYAWRRDWQRTLYDAGWAAPGWPAEYGGQGLPHLARFIFDEMLCSANLSFSMYPELGHGAALALEAAVITATALCVGVLAAGLTARALVTHVDPLAQWSPPLTLVIPWSQLIVALVAATAIAALLGAAASLVAGRGDVARELRVA